MGSCFSSTCLPTTNNRTDDNKSKHQHTREKLAYALPEPVAKGAKGLRELGLEYRCLPCSEHLQKETKPAASSGDSKPTLMCLECSHRIYLLQDSDTTNIDNNDDKEDVLITMDNRKKYIPGRIYDPASRAAQEEVVEWMKRDFSLERVPLFSTGEDQENEKHSDENDNATCIVTALVTTPEPSTPGGTLVIINGRGVARAGILSTRHTFESGVEKGSAAVHISQARERRMAVVCLDTNAQGTTNMLDTIIQSLDSPALAPYLRQRPLFFLCHSAAGGNLVQYLLRDHLEACHFSMEQIQALVFTDSTHDLQWLSLQNHPSLKTFLQSPICLYIRNNREHAGDTFGPNHRHQKAGEPYNASRDAHWKKRFGNIRTVYAGTTDHSLMCYQARNVIWEFFDSKGAMNSKGKE